MPYHQHSTSTKIDYVLVNTFHPWRRRQNIGIRKFWETTCAPYRIRTCLICRAKNYHPVINGLLEPQTKVQIKISGMLRTWLLASEVQRVSPARFCKNASKRISMFAQTATSTMNSSLDSWPHLRPWSQTLIRYVFSLIGESIMDKIASFGDACAILKTEFHIIAL